MAKKLVFESQYIWFPSISCNCFSFAEFCIARHHLLYYFVFLSLFCPSLFSLSIFSVFILMNSIIFNFIRITIYHLFFLRACACSLHSSFEQCIFRACAFGWATFISSLKKESNRIITIIHHRNINTIKWDKVNYRVEQKKSSNVERRIEGNINI